MGNQYSIKPTTTRQDPVRSFRIPALLLAAFVRAAKRAGISTNKWLVGAGEERLAREKAEREAAGK